MDHLTPLPRDSAMRVVNRVEGVRLKKAKEDKKRKKMRQLWSWEREDTDDDDNDDDGNDDEVMEVADNIKWDNLENEDALTCIGSSS